MKQMLQICCKNNNIYKEFAAAHRNPVPAAE